MPFTTIMVKNIPVAWSAHDLHNCFSSACGGVVGTFIYFTLDEFGHKCGLVELDSQVVAYDLCVKGELQTTTIESGVTAAALSLTPTDVRSLAAWLGFVPADELKQGPTMIYGAPEGPAKYAPLTGTFLFLFLFFFLLSSITC